MPSCALSVEHVEITITSTNTTGTADVSLGQTTANCILLVSFKSATGASTINTRLPEVYFSGGTTITAERNTGTDIGTITIMVEVIEFDPAQVKVQQGTFSLSSSELSNTATLAEAVAATSSCFFVINGRTSFSSTNYARNAFCHAEFIDDQTIEFTRSAGSNSITGRYFLAEALAGEFTVLHGTITLGNSAETNDDPLGDDVDLTKTCVFVTMLNGHTGDDWRTTGVRAFLGDTAGASSIFLARANGGTASATGVTCKYQAVTFTQDETVQRGVLTITGTSDTDTLGAAVSLDSATVHSPMTYGMGEGDDTDGTLVGGWFAHMELTATDTVTGSVVTDITPAGVYSYEVIDWALTADIVAQCIGQAEAIKGIGAAGIGQAESLLSISAPGVGESESLRGFGSTGIGEAESLLGIGASGVGQGESLLGVGAAGIGQAEVTRGIAAAAISQVEALLGVSAAGVGQAEALGTIVVVATGAGQVEALAGELAKHAAQVESLRGIHAPASPVVEALRGVAAVGAGQAEALGFVVVAAPGVGQVEVLLGVRAPALSQVESLLATLASASSQVEALRGLAALGRGQVEVWALAILSSHDQEMLLLSRDLFACVPITEPVTYYPLGEVLAGRAIRALIVRSPLEPLDFVEGGGRLGREIDIYILRHDDGGVLNVAPGRDTVDLAVNYGETPTRCRVTTIRDADVGKWHLTVTP